MTPPTPNVAGSPRVYEESNILPSVVQPAYCTVTLLVVRRVNRAGPLHEHLGRETVLLDDRVLRRRLHVRRSLRPGQDVDQLDTIVTSVGVEPGRARQGERRGHPQAFASRR